MKISKEKEKKRKKSKLKQCGQTYYFWNFFYLNDQFDMQPAQHGIL